MDKASPAHELAEVCIFTALLQLLEKKPYEEITITDITKRAGVSRMAYYRNYQSKDEILTKHLEQVYERLLDHAEQHDLSQEQFWMSFLLEFRNNLLIQGMVKANLTEKIYQCHLKYSRECIQRYYHWELKNTEDVLLFNYQMGGVMAIVNFALTDGGDLSESQLATFLANLQLISRK